MYINLEIARDTEIQKRNNLKCDDSILEDTIQL